MIDEETGNDAGKDKDEFSFTLVFKGNLREFGFNSLKTVTPFGVPYAAGIGDAFQEKRDGDYQRYERVREFERANHAERIIEDLRDQIERLSKRI